MSASITRIAVANQLAAMRCDRFDIGVLRANHRMILREDWSADKLQAALNWLRRENPRGSHIFVRPHGVHALSLVHDLSGDAIARVMESAFQPALIVETSPANFQVWLNHSRILGSELSTKSPRRRIQIKNDANQTTGVPLRKYEALHHAVAALPAKDLAWNGPRALIVPRGRYKAPINPLLKDLIGQYISRIIVFTNGLRTESDRISRASRSVCAGFFCAASYRNRSFVIDSGPDADCRRPKCACARPWSKSGSPVRYLDSEKNKGNCKTPTGLLMRAFLGGSRWSGKHTPYARD